MNPRLRTPFTPRERQVADLIGDNKSYQEIGEALGLSPHTVRAYVIQMAMKIDFCREPAPEPRLAVYSFVLHERFVAQGKAV